MRAIQANGYGPPDVLEPVDLPTPEPIATEVLVRVQAAGVNPVDWKTRARGPGGVVQLEPPVVLGWDVAGVVDQVGGGVTRFAVGDEVFGMPWFPRLGRAYAEYVTAPSRQFARIPEGLDTVQAGGLPLAGLTAWRALVTRGRVAAGMRVLVTGAGGGAATFLIQIAHALGADVIVTSSSDDTIARAIELGAVRGVRYTDSDWPEQVGEVDLVVDSAGTPAWAGALKCLRRGGTLVSFGRTAGNTAEIDLPSLFYGQWNVLGTTMGSPREFDALLEHVEQAAWRPVVDSVFLLEQAAAAHEQLEQPARFGKVVLECRSI